MAKKGKKLGAWELARLGRFTGKLLPDRVRSGRVGSHGGQATRTFHAHFGSIKGGRSAAGPIDYISREGDYDDRDDLEAVVGDRERLEADLELISNTSRIKNGPRAERVAITMVIELPPDSNQMTRRGVADAIVARAAAEGRSALVAIHRGHPDGKPATHHLHVIEAARPVRDGQVDRGPGTRRLVGKASVRAERLAIAEMVNDLCQPEVRFHGGRDAEMDDPAIKDRAPQTAADHRGDRRRAWSAEQKAAWRENKKAEEAEAKARQAMKRVEREAKFRAKPAVKTIRTQLSDRAYAAVRNLNRAKAAELEVTKARTLTDHQRAMLEPVLALWAKTGRVVTIPQIEADVKLASEAWARARELQHKLIEAAKWALDDAKTAKAAAPLPPTPFEAAWASEILARGGLGYVGKAVAGEIMSQKFARELIRATVSDSPLNAREAREAVVARGIVPDPPATRPPGRPRGGRGM